MSLRPYQSEFIDAVMRDLIEHDRVLGVAATGAGKTIIAAELTKRCLPYGPVLFLADAKELVYQAAEKIGGWTGLLNIGVEMADSHAVPGDQVVVATTQSMAVRLDKWPADYFGLIIVDEAHRNTLGAQAQSVLNHFSAQVLGITATPFRSDKKQLGNFYQTVSAEVGLMRLIKEGYLSRIRIKSVPVDIDLSKVRSRAGDYREADLGKAVEPHLMRCAEILAEHAPDRKTVVFLPLIQTSKAFARCCREVGLRAVHVDGTDREALRSDWQVICNASLLTTGWDEPSVDCVYIIRPTKSLVLYSQMVGRGTRIFPGKEDLLVLDPLYLSDSMDLIRPARLVAKTEQEAKEIQAKLDATPGGGSEQMDLLEAEEEAENERHKALIEKLKKRATRKARTVDAVEFALSLGRVELAEYEPEMKWESEPPSKAQLDALERAGFDAECIKCKGHASQVLDLLTQRRQMGLATPKQLKWLVQLRHSSPDTCTFEEASEFLDCRFGGKKKAS